MDDYYVVDDDGSDFADSSRYVRLISKEFFISYGINNSDEDDEWINRLSHPKNFN